MSWARLAHFWATIYTADAVFAGNGYNLRLWLAGFKGLLACVLMSIAPSDDVGNVDAQA
jgi:hypothetical protein